MKTPENAPDDKTRPAGEDHSDDQEFFEAVPGALDRNQLDHTEAHQPNSDAERRSLLAWLLIPLVALLALALLSALLTNGADAPGRTLP